MAKQNKLPERKANPKPNYPKGGLNRIYGEAVLTKAKEKIKPIKIKEEKPQGRPSKYLKEVADLICEEIATSSKSLRTICLNEKYPSVGTIL